LDKHKFLSKRRKKSYQKKELLPDLEWVIWGLNLDPLEEEDRQEGPRSVSEFTISVDRLVNSHGLREEDIRLNTGNREWDERRVRFVHEIPNGQEILRKELERFRDLTDWLICRGRRLTPELESELKLSGKRYFPEPMATEGPLYQEKQRLLRQYKDADLEMEYQRQKSSYENAKEEYQNAEKWDKEFMEKPSLPPLLKFFKQKEGRPEDKLSYLYDFLFHEKKKKRRRIGHCLNESCQIFFWAKRNDADFCSEKCRIDNWKSKNERHVREYHREDMRARRS